MSILFCFKKKTPKNRKKSFSGSKSYNKFFVHFMHLTVLTFFSRIIDFAKLQIKALYSTKTIEKFLISPQKHMLWVLIRSTWPRPF